jgi:non-ribosomal peptide synthase protein (TIGR01720 family)
MAEDNRSLQRLLVGGDQLSHVANRSYDVFNNYGPTENTVVTTSCPVHADDATLPIGQPIANNHVYVLNEELQLQPIGVPGELWISGDSLARGYLHRPKLTAEKFIANPWLPGERMYRTGDLVRRLADGSLEYLGRIDNQVKIRGYRIELGEIEARLLEHPQVQEVIVVPTTEGTELCAYLVMDETCDVASLRSHLAETMPDYMIPAYFVNLPALPLTAHGKVDKKALPEPSSNVKQGVAFVAPRNEQEKLIASLWQEVLGIDNVGVHHNFFALGGDSVKAMQVAARLSQYHYRLKIKDLFQYPTIAGLAPRITYYDGEESSTQTIVTGDVPLTPIQQWAFALQKHIHHWNMGHMLYAKNGWNPQIVAKVFARLIEHHDVLRMTYQWIGDQVKQSIRSLDEGEFFSLQVFDLTQEDDVEGRILNEANEIQQSIRLDEGPLVKLGLFQTTAGDHLLIVIHHLVVDAISLRVIVEDFTNGYEQARQQEKIVLPAKTDSFQLWSQKLHQYANSPTLLTEIPYWKTIEQTKLPALPIDKEGPKTYPIGKGKIVIVTLSERETRKLLTDVHHLHQTEINDVLVAALVQTIGQWADVEQVGITFEGHGRQEVVENIDVTRTVGWFTTMYPLICTLDCGDISQTLQLVKQTRRSVPQQGIGHSLLKYLTDPSKKQDLSFTLQPEILFNYLGQIETYSLQSMPVGYAVHPLTEMEAKLEVNSAVTMEGTFVLSIRYNPFLYHQTTIENLAEQYKQNLLSIIAQSTTTQM